MDHPKYAQKVFQSCAEDRPLIAQFCGNDPDLFLSAVKCIEDQIDAVDINFGCPQGIAKRGNYGAFLLTQVDTMCALVKKLHSNLKIPICAKIRIVKSEEETLRICRLLRENGISILTVHGRTIGSKKQKIGNCDFEMIKKIKAMMDIPVFANGGCEHKNEVLKCLEITGCDGYMAAESILSNPAMFVETDEVFDSFKMARDYVSYCKLCKEEKNWNVKHKHVAMKGHLFKILYRELTVFQDLRNYLGATTDIEWIWNVVDVLEEKRKQMDCNLYQFLYDIFTVNWYHRHWKPYEQMELMETWDEIVSECTKPLDFAKNRIEIIRLLIKYRVINEEECKIKLMLSDGEINELKQKIQTQQEEEELMRRIGKNAQSEASLINSMFGYDNDESENDTESDSNESIILDID